MEILKKKQLKCYLYTRVSTSMQVDGYSLDAQRDKLRKYAAYEDMIVAGEYSDEGFSGKNIQGRQEFQRMLNDIQDGKDDVSYVLVFKLSRFGRNAADVLNSLQLMQDFGVNLICVEDGIDSSSDWDYGVERFTDSSTYDQAYEDHHSSSSDSSDSSYDWSSSDSWDSGSSDWGSDW